MSVMACTSTGLVLPVVCLASEGRRKVLTNPLVPTRVLTNPLAPKRVLTNPLVPKRVLTNPLVPMRVLPRGENGKQFGNTHLPEKHLKQNTCNCCLLHLLLISSSFDLDLSGAELFVLWQICPADGLQCKICDNSVLLFCSFAFACWYPPALTWICRVRSCFVLWQICPTVVSQRCQ